MLILKINGVIILLIIKSTAKSCKISSSSSKLNPVCLAVQHLFHKRGHIPTSKQTGFHYRDQTARPNSFNSFCK